MNRQHFEKVLIHLNQQAFEEFNVLQLVLKGHTDDEIALLRNRSKSTVRKQISNIYKKFNVTGKYEGDRTSRRYELIALFQKYQPECLPEFNISRINENEVSTSQENFSSASNKKSYGEPGSAHIGSARLSTDSMEKIILDADELITNHMALLAEARADKSQLVRVLIEELSQPYNRAAIILFDPYGEYGTLTEIQDNTDFYSKDGYKPRVKVITPESICIRYSSLDYGDLLLLLPEMSERQQVTLTKAIALIKRHKRGQYHWDIEDLIVASYEVDRLFDESGHERVGSSALTLEYKLEELRKLSCFHTLKHLTPKDLLEPGQVTVLQMHNMSQKEQQVICGIILKQITQARINTQNELISLDSENCLPYPTFIFIEGAHRYAPNGSNLNCNDILRNILIEGWSFGVGLGLATQYPSQLDNNLLAFCNNYLIMRLTSPANKNVLQYCGEVAKSDFFEKVSILSKNEVLISGSTLQNSTLCHVRQSFTKDASRKARSSTSWISYFKSKNSNDLQNENQ